MIQILTSPLQLQEFLSSESIVVVDFYATWCEPCKWLDEILDEVDYKILIPITIVKIDADKFQEIADLYLVKSVPVLFIFKDNTLNWRLNGFLTADEMIAKILAISRGTAGAP